jgi:hypothetical protein
MMPIAVVGRAMESPLYFHTQNARPGGILFLVVGIVGLCGTWLFADAWPPRIIATAIFGTFAVGGGHAAFVGGYYRSWFADGHFYWTYPSRLDGRNDACVVGNVVEFQLIMTVGGVDSSCGSDRYRLILQDGTMKDIAPQCVGNAAAFYQALRKENPSIRYIQLQK